MNNKHYRFIKHSLRS